MASKAILGTYSDYATAYSEKRKFSKIFPDYKYQVKKTGNVDFPYRVIYFLRKGHKEPASAERLRALEKL